MMKTNINLLDLDNDILNIIGGYVKHDNNRRIRKEHNFNETDFNRGVPFCVIGNKVAEELFGKSEKALGKTISYGGRRLQIIGVIEKQGSSMIGGFDYDKATVVPYYYFASIFNPDNNSPYIMVQAKPGIPSKALQDELNGIMRQLRKLSPSQEDNFTCNDVAQFKDQIERGFGSINQGCGPVLISWSLWGGQYHVCDGKRTHQSNWTKKSHWCQE